MGESTPPHEGGHFQRWAWPPLIPKGGESFTTMTLGANGIPSINLSPLEKVPTSMLLGSEYKLGNRNGDSKYEVSITALECFPDSDFNQSQRRKISSFHSLAPVSSFFPPTTVCTYISPHSFTWLLLRQLWRERDNFLSLVFLSSPEGRSLQDNILSLHKVW